MKIRAIRKPKYQPKLRKRTNKWKAIEPLPIYQQPPSPLPSYFPPSPYPFSDLERRLDLAFGKTMSKKEREFFLDLFDYLPTTEQLFSMAFWWEEGKERGESSESLLSRLYKKHKPRSFK